MGERPVRLQLSRAKGFNLQAMSRATNGLEAVNVARPSKWGNPWKVDRFGVVTPTAKDAVEQFRQHEVPEFTAEGLRELRGKNLACWCHINDRWCHAQVLIELANAE